MKSKTFRMAASIFTIGVFLFLAFGSSSAWKKKVFDTDDDLTKAFQNAKYDDVKKAFGEPYYKFLDVVDQTVTYRWHGVRVKGESDAYLIFTAIEYGTFNYSGFDFKTWYNNEGYNALSNDNTYTID